MAIAVSPFRVPKNGVAMDIDFGSGNYGNSARVSATPQTLGSLFQSFNSAKGVFSMLSKFLGGF